MSEKSAMTGLFLILIGASIGLSAKAGVVRIATNNRYKNNNIVIGKQTSGDPLDLGEWSPPCQFSPRNDFSGRYLRCHCEEPDGEWVIDIYLKNPTAEDQNRTYVCGDGSLASWARINCTSSYRTVENSGAWLRMSSGLLVLETGLALYVTMGA